MNLSALTPTEIGSILNRLPDQEPYTHFPSELLDGPPRPAAVLLGLLRVKDQWEVLFIRRTVQEGDYHSGQVALPGGAREADDPDNIAAAIRETTEELGIQPRDIEVLGTLNDFITISNFQVTPVIAVVRWPVEITLAEDEVARAFTIPLKWMADPANHEIRHRQLPNGLGNASVIYYEKFDGELLWGATARILFEFFSVLGIIFPEE